MAEKLIASDTFQRTLSAGSGWGSADLGGAWVGAGTFASAEHLSVNGSEGVANLPLGGGGNLTLATPCSDTRAEVTYTTVGSPATASIYGGVLARVAGAANYRITGWHRGEGDSWLLVQRNGAVVGSPAVAAAPGWVDGSKYHVKCEVTGTDIVTLKAKLWADGAAEPAWQITVVDDDPGKLIAPGSVGIYGYRGGTGSGTASARFDNFTATDLSAPDPAPPIPMYVGTKQVQAIYVGNGKVDPA